MVCIKKQPYIYYVRLTFKNRHFFRYLTCLLDRGHINTGALTISISIIRNSLMVKKKMTKTILTILIIIQIIVGTYLNQLGIIGYLPIISSVSYSLAIATTPNRQWLRWVIIENMLLWLIYDLTIQAYPAAVTDVTITLTTLIAIIRNRKTFSKQ